MPAHVSEKIATHLAEVQFEQLPASAVDAAKRSLLDALGVMLGASGLGEGCEAFASLAGDESPAGPCWLWGWGTTAALLPAVLANGALAHALDFEDAFDEAPCHPNAALVPAALALTQARGPISGPTLITAIAAGCDLVCRLALGLRSDPADGGWYWPPILGAFGAAACAGRLLRLSPAQMLDALSLTLCQSTCSAELKYSRRSVVRAVRDGFSAHAGLLSALLAQRGVAGFEQPIEGRAGLYALYARGQWEPQALTQRLGMHFYGAEVSFKPWPSCRGTHALIEAALGLRRSPGFRLADIGELRTYGGSVQQMLTEPRAQKLRPQTAIDAKFSIPFTVASALVHGELTLRSFRAEALADPKVLALAGRVSFQVESTADDPTAGALEIVMRDGQVLSKRVIHPRGHYSSPLSWQELCAKFQMCAAEARVPLSNLQSTRLLQFIQELEQQPDATGALAGILGA